MVNISEAGTEGLEQLFDRIYHYSGSSEIIESVLIHLSTQTGRGELVFAVEIDHHSTIPTLISVSNQLLYFEVLQSLRMQWLMTQKGN